MHLFPRDRLDRSDPRDRSHCRRIQAAVDAWVGYRPIYAVLSILFTLALVGLGLWRRGIRHGLRVTLRQGLCILLFSGLSVGGSLYLARDKPIEAIHFVEYGVLALLWLRWALYAHPNPGAFPIALLATVLTGVLDELWQWVVPRRYFDVRDIAINAVGGLLALGLIRYGLTPTYLRPACSSRSRLAVRRLWAGLMALAFFCATATPAALARLPWLGTAAAAWEPIVEYGHLHRDPAIGSWKSRFSAPDLARTDAARAADVAAILRDNAHLSYDGFLRVFSPASDPFTHEFRVRLFRRDNYRLGRKKYLESDPARYRLHCRVALMEQAILEKAFPETLAAAQAMSVPIPAEAFAEMRANADLTPDYHSPVSSQLIHRFSMEEVLAFCLLIGSGVWLALGRVPTEDPIP